MTRAPFAPLSCFVAIALVASCAGGGGEPADGGGADIPRDTGAKPEVPIITAAPSDAGWSLPPGFAAPPQPLIACDGADGGPTTCDVPLSVCPISTGCDAGYEACEPVWFIYYENPRCVDGRCVWDEGTFRCTQSFYYCRRGACVYESPTI